ncbi:MAG: hypothetical protein P8X82_15750 [Gemmatimonadales bacterium]
MTRQHLVPTLTGFALTAAMLSAPAQVVFGGLPPLPELITVGPEENCDFASLETAIDAARFNSNGSGNDFIFVSKNHADADGSIFVLNEDISIYGGFDSCGSVAASGTTTVSGGGPVMTITAAADSPHTVVLRDLEITDGNSATNGGGLSINGPVTVILEGDTTVTGNEAADGGGGIFVNGDFDAQLQLRDTASVSNNLARNGGGIFCTGIAEASALVDLGETTAVFLNDATLDATGAGGGIVVSTGCDLVSRAGGLFAGIFLNEADVGGGLVVDNGAQADLIGGTSVPAILNNNVARLGGGAFVDDEGSRLDALNAWIVNNLATEDGGGAYVNDGGVLVMDRTLGETCHDPVRCSRLALNHAGQPGSSGRGGGVYVDGEEGCGEDGQPACPLTTADFGRTYLEENSVEDHANSRGSLGVAQDHAYRFGKTRIRLLGSVADRNQNGRELLYSTDDLVIEYSTITANTNNSRVITMLFQDPPSIPCCTDGHSRLVLEYSTIWEQVDTLVVIKEGTVGFPDDYNFEGGVTCFNGEFQSLLDASADDEFCCWDVEEFQSTDPLFVNAPGGDYHLSEMSPLIDFCDDLSPAQATDIELEPRGVDDALTPNVGGPFDVGADEVQPGVEASIFSDGFESGDTTVWSSTVP